MNANNAVMNPLVKQLVEALRLARGYMSDSIEYEMPCAKKDAATVDDAIAAAIASRVSSAQLMARTPRVIRFHISYRDAAYRVSIPMYEGGEVINAEAYDALVEQRTELLEALTETWRVLRAAGTLNLSNGVQLGQTSWYVKICDAESKSDDAIAKATGGAK